MTRTDMLRIAAYERLNDDEAAQELLNDLLEVTYQQGRADGFNQACMQIGGACASVPRADDVPAECADGFQRSVP